MKKLMIVNANVVQRLARILRVLCILGMIFLCVALVSGLIGRIPVTLVSADGTRQDALLSGGSLLGGFRTSPGYTQFIIATENGVSFWTWLCLALMCLVYMLPPIFGAYFLVRFFGNIAAAKVFTEENARLLTGSGLLLIAGQVLWAVLFLVSPLLVGWLSSNTLTIGGQLVELGTLFLGFIFLIAGYIMQYGLTLQEEVDYTL